MNLKDMVGVRALQQKFQNSFERVMENMQDENTPYKDEKADHDHNDICSERTEG